MKADIILICALGTAMFMIPSAVLLSQSSKSANAPADSSVSNIVSYSSSQSAPSLAASVSGEWSKNPVSSSEERSSALTGDIQSLAAIEYFKVLDTSSGEVINVSKLDFVLGAIAAEMPASYHTQALTAQGVAAYTLALYRTLEQMRSPDPALMGADFSADPKNGELFMERSRIEEIYSENSDYYLGRLTSAAQEALSSVIVYENEPILAAYHAISAGVTESSGYVWQYSPPYLVSVSSAGDILSKDFRSSALYSWDTLSELLTNEGVTFGDDVASRIEILERSPAGYVISVRVGDTVMTGQKLRSLLSLRSSCFTVELCGKDVAFEVKGYGHGVGLSQNGADYFARQGWNYQKILTHYYHGASLLSIKNNSQTLTTPK